MSLLVTGQVEKVVINDLDPAIYAFWHTVVNDPDALIRRVTRAKLDVKEWKRQRDIYRTADPQDTVALGFATFYLNRTNRSGALNGGPIGGLDQTGTYKIDARFNRKALAERIRILALYADRMTVSCHDGMKVIRKHGRRPGTFIYADPPYFEKAGSLYLNAFSEGDHRALAETLNERADGAWLLTYDNVPEVGELYAARRRRMFQLNYSAHRVMRATEVAVLSDAIADVGDGWPH